MAAPRALEGSMMLSKVPVSYVPALRLKQGEYRALTKLAPDVADRIVPRLVIPPPKEHDPEKGRLLTKEEILRETGARIGWHWPVRPAFLEPAFLFREFGEADSLMWLPQIFEGARQANGCPVPLATLDDMLGVRAEAFRRAMGKDTQTRIAVRVQSSEVDGDLAARVREAMSRLGIACEDCAVLLDFADADISNVNTVVPILVGALEAIQVAGLWQRIIFQGTNYPEKNPAREPEEDPVRENSSVTVARTEWLTWCAAVQEDANIAEHLIFGDYGADNAKFEFQTGGGVPIRHYRYCTRDTWEIVRGRGNVSCKEAMRSVSQHISDQDAFAGADFSSADEFIYGTAKGYAGPGNPSKWREINTIHHITRVVSDIGRMRGFNIARRAIAVPPRQTSFFDPEP